ncbi:protein phosphatase 1 regulatory subunit 14D isoform X3 [Myotis lucifugus]|uniref:protein phosphatase 1 regulatory subunit 14D isoform X3 n=1 Tax=Myotis lucifugus TaxID=59463 RepID=UPI000CCC8EA1|nr:protein phosphatase 1 regulatory subunit 14D isoform X3 [Myotis lucifugus]
MYPANHRRTPQEAELKSHIYCNPGLRGSHALQISKCPPHAHHQIYRQRSQRENSSKKVQWASGKRRTSSTDSESKSHPDPSKASRSRRPSRLTVKYDRGHLQRWLDVEQWVDAKVQELFQPFISELLSQLKKLRRLSRPQK